MNTQRPQFDSHRFVKRLTMAGLSEEVAEILADEHTSLTVPGDVATKADIGAVKADIDAVKAVMATKKDLDAVKAVMVTKKDLAASEARMEQLLRNAILEAKISLIKWMIATTIATMAVFSGVVIGAMTATQ